MGRIFEKRKTTMFARWDRMAKAFTRAGREIAMAMRSGSTDPNSNPALRRAIANARAANMPREKIENAIKKAAGTDGRVFETVVYEGYAPHAIAIVIETATDNPQRTVANVRSIMKDWGGSFGQTGSVAFMFNHMGVFRLSPEGLSQEELELELIDHGLEEMGESVGEKGEPQIVIRCLFADFGQLQKALEDRKLTPLSAEHEYICLTPTELPEPQATEVMELVDKLEQDDDVQKVYHTLA